MVRVGAVRTRAYNHEIDNGVLLQDELFQFLSHLRLSAARLEEFWHLCVDCIDGLASLAQLSNLSFILAGKKLRQRVGSQLIIGLWHQILKTQDVVCSQRLPQGHVV